MDDVAIRAYQCSMYFLFASVLWWTIKLATRLVFLLPALLLNACQRRKLRQSVWQWDCIIIWYYRSQQILHLYTMKVIHNFIVTSLVSVSAQKLLSWVQVLKSSTCECSKTPLASVLAKRSPITKISLSSASACSQLELASVNLH